MAVRPSITVVDNGRLNKDFVGGCALQNARAVLRRAQPNGKVKGRSVTSILTQLPEEGIEISADEFRKAIWDLMEDGYKGNVHVSLISLGPLLQTDAASKLSQANASWGLAASNDTIRTRQVLDSKLEGEKSVRMLYIGQAEADIYDEDESFTQEVDGEEYLFKAYRIVDVPVFSRVDIDLTGPYISVITRAVHQRVRQFTEVEGLRDLLRNSLDVEVPPLGGIGPGIRALWGNSITPRKYEVHEPDGSKVNFSCASGARNPSSEQVENALLTWEFKNGALLFDDGTVKAPFFVDAGKASFSFGASVTKEQVDHVISAILAAA